VIRFKYSLEKAIQATAVILKQEGSQAERTRVLKLLYIADRESLSERGTPIVGGRILALDNGPLHAEVYDLIRGQHESESTWNQFFRSEGYKVFLIADPGRLELSPYEVGKLTEVCERHRNQSTWKVADLTQEFQEWIDCHASGKSEPIPAEKLLAALGFDEEEIKETIAEAEYYRRVQKVMDSRETLAEN
jgi:uncharacterized phage-associated protein